MQNNNLLAIQQEFNLVLKMSPVDPERLQKTLLTLSDYECWALYIELFEKCQKKPTVEEAINLVRICSLNLENQKLTEEKLNHLLRQFHLKFDSLQLDILPLITYSNDYEMKYELINAVYQTFRDSSERIKALEYQAFILEKKIHDEPRLTLIYEKLLRLAPDNRKALRYFKATHLQAKDFELACQTLESLIKYANNQYEEQLYGFELAQIYLYHLDNPQKSLTIMNRYCKQSTLDTSLVFYQLYEKSESWLESIGILRKIRASSKKEAEQAIIDFLLGERLMFVGEIEEAKLAFETAISLQPSLLNPYEGLIKIALTNDQTELAIHWINALSLRLGSSYNKDRLNTLKNELIDAEKIYDKH
jgi:tetratricopeptide (TPR) repeat protein